MEDELSNHDTHVEPGGDYRTITLEAYADTVIPGEKRWAGDRAIAGVATGGGAVQAGALELLAWDATGIHEGLDDLARLLNGHTERYAEEQGLTLDQDVPPSSPWPTRTVPPSSSS